MTEFRRDEGRQQAAKATVRALYDAMAGAQPDQMEGLLAAHTVTDWRWRGMHPFHEQTGAAAVARLFWEPLTHALHRLQRREDIFIAGLNEIDGFEGVWTISMGHLMGLFDRPFLNIPPTGKIALLRYAEFNRVEDGKITETALFVDLIHLMKQAGLDPLPPQTAAELVQPGPMTHDGLLRAPGDPAESARTLAIINSMISDINDHSQYASPQEELSHTWHDDMAWWGPSGIGATYTIDRYADQHQQPFRRGIRERRFNGHVCRLAEGAYGGFFGWANLTVTNGGGFMGLPAGRPADMRVVDIYRRAGDKLAENWIFIDLLHWLNQQGLDVLARSCPGETAP